MSTDPKTIVDTRKQLHWASQLLSAAADATLEKADDDSHSNLGWDSALSRLVGRSGCSIAVEEFKLIRGESSLELQGKTLESARAWLAEQLDAELSFRDYEMPDHPVASGQTFAVDANHLKAIAEWFTLAQPLLVYGAVRIWPHHFDMGFWNAGDDTATSIGGGFSLGDEHYDQPYFYVNPYGVERPSTLPGLPVGHWTDLWVGAVLTSEEMKLNSPTNAEHSTLAKEFLDSAMVAAKQLIN